MSQHQVKKLIAAPGPPPLFICDVCVDLSYGVIHDDPALDSKAAMAEINREADRISEMVRAIRGTPTPAEVIQQMEKIYHDTKRRFQIRRPRHPSY